MRSIARGIDAAEVLPVSTMSRATATRSGQLELLDHGVDDPQVRLVRDEDVEVVGGDAGGVERLLATGAICEDRPAEDLLARSSRSVGNLCPGSSLRVVPRLASA